MPARSHAEEDVHSGEAEECQREAPEHREDETAVAKRLATVQAVQERLVGVGFGPKQCAASRVDHELAVFTTATLAGENGDERLLSLEFDVDFVDGRGVRGSFYDRDRGSDFRLPFTRRCRARDRTRQLAIRFPQRFIRAEEFRKCDHEAGNRGKDQECTCGDADPAMPAAKPPMSAADLVTAQSLIHLVFGMQARKFGVQMNLTLPPPEEKATAVQGMFSAIAPRYDLLNHLLSLNIDKYWRRRAIDGLLAGNDPAGKYLDACAGTMDLSVEIARRASFSGSVIASDFAFPMMQAGLHKLRGKSIEPVCGDAMRLPFRDNEFDGACVGFGVRNLSSVSDGVRELTRVLRPGGRLVILEFTTPSWQPFRGLYMTYFKHVLPGVGKLISKHGSAYSYLPASVLQFPEPPELAEIMRSCGLGDVQWRRLTGGIVAIHAGTK